MKPTRSDKILAGLLLLVLSVPVFAFGVITSLCGFKGGVCSPSESVQVFIGLVGSIVMFITGLALLVSGARNRRK